MHRSKAISAERLQDLRLSGDLWVPKKEKLRILFNPDIDVIVDENLGCDFYVLGRDNIYAPKGSPLLIDPDFVKKVRVSPDVFLRSFSIRMRASPIWQDFYHGFEDMHLRKFNDTPKLPPRETQHSGNLPYEFFNVESNYSLDLLDVLTCPTN
ncbi:hypothetical protein BCON_0114g00160 [Botryotinia convoluta]|uniref:Uncharacterized protein n=1 Tax=Botryotinia convoluta TaxID=54673 RepID=A0A4Z1HY97_9HELO|nr:hypothetical protein BCON_0114g00160 [Botryotinia convoluta]